MFKKLLPTSTDFFGLFEEHCTLTLQAARELVSVLEDPQNLSQRLALVHELEHKADRVTHRCIVELQKTFITPFDRIHIHLLIKEMDDVIDCVTETASRLQLYEIKEVRSEALEIARLIVSAVEVLGSALKLFRELRYERSIKEMVVKVHSIENEADKVLRSAIHRLFAEQVHPYLVIQWKEIFELLELATDKAEDITDIVEGVIIEAS